MKDDNQGATFAPVDGPSWIISQASRAALAMSITLLNIALLMAHNHLAAWPIAALLSVGLFALQAQMAVAILRDQDWASAALGATICLTSVLSVTVPAAAIAVLSVGAIASLMYSLLETKIGRRSPRR